jgi:hypothetical protein
MHSPDAAMAPEPLRAESPEGLSQGTMRLGDPALAPSAPGPTTASIPEWLPVKTSDWRLRALRDRHYAGGVGGATVGQPGKRIAFVTFEGTAGWVSHWPKPEFIDHAFGEAFVCTLFRKECDGLASAMIESAMALTEARWGAPPEGGWLTFVDPAEVESPNPGYCFKQAGFRPCGFTKDRHLLVLRREPVPELIEAVA